MKNEVLVAIAGGVLCGFTYFFGFQTGVRSEIQKHEIKLAALLRQEADMISQFSNEEMPAVSAEKAETNTVKVLPVLGQGDADLVNREFTGDVDFSRRMEEVNRRALERAGM